jgi:hypothetical protein
MKWAHKGVLVKWAVLAFQARRETMPQLARSVTEAKLARRVAMAQTACGERSGRVDSLAVSVSPALITHKMDRRGRKATEARWASATACLDRPALRALRKMAWLDRRA